MWGSYMNHNIVSTKIDEGSAYLSIVIKLRGRNHNGFVVGEVFQGLRWGERGGEVEMGDRDENRWELAVGERSRVVDSEEAYIGSRS